MTGEKNPVIMKNAGFPAERKGRPLEIRFGNKSQEAAIREEYRRIDEKWLRMQCRLMLFLVLFTTAIEAVMYFVLRGLRVNVADAQVYFAKYLLAPLAADTLLWLGAVAAVHSGLPPMKKAYAVSILMAIMAFIVYTVHAVFPAVTAAFIIPMLATVVYADQNLTTVVAALCVAEKFCSDLFLIWDPGRAGVLESTGSVVNFGLSLVLLVIFYGICSVMILTEKEKNEVSIRLERERQRYREESLTDQLTRVWNRQALRQMFQRMEEEREETAFFLAMLDMDDFKNLNDTYGHSQGDNYLRSLGRVLLDLAGEQMVPFRFGGDEFCVIFCGCDQERVGAACRAIQECFARAEVNCSHKTVTVSIGVAEFRKKEPPAQLLDRADAALYRAKQNKGSICFEL